MLRRMCLRLVIAASLALLIALVNFVILPVGHSHARERETLRLNRQSGPLGVTLALSGANFPPGSAGLSYIDSQNVPGMFVAPGATSVVVSTNGSFSANNVMLPQSGASGNWKIVVTDNLGTISTIRYSVLAAPGQATAGSPTLTLTQLAPVAGTAGTTGTNTPTTSTSHYTFAGTNWLPQKTAVNLLLQAGGNTLPLLEPAPVSDSNGDISGTFSLPANLTVTSATVVATDAATGALSAQASITLASATITPTASPSPTVTDTPITTVTPSPTTTPAIASNSGGPGDTHSASPLGRLDAVVWGPVLLIVGAILAIAALMLVLFMLPWSERGKSQNKGLPS